MSLIFTLGEKKTKASDVKVIKVNIHYSSAPLLGRDEEPYGGSGVRPTSFMLDLLSTSVQGFQEKALQPRSWMRQSNAMHACDFIPDLAFCDFALQS